MIGIAAALIGGDPIFNGAFENFVERKMTMELSMTNRSSSGVGERRVLHRLLADMSTEHFTMIREYYSKADK